MEYTTPDYSSNVRISSMQQQLAELTSLIHQLAVGKAQARKVCSICSVVGHPTDMCPLLRKESYEQVNVACGFSGPPQWQYDPYSNMHNSGWRDHPNFHYENSHMHQPTTSNFSSYQQYNQPYPHCQQQGQFSNSNSNSNKSLNDIVQTLATNSIQFQQKTNAALQSLSTQLEQMATAVTRLAARNAELPSHTVVDQEDDESETVLSIGNKIEPPTLIAPASPTQEKADNISADAEIVYIDNDVICADDIFTVHEVVEQIDKEKLEDTIIHSLDLEPREEIFTNEEIKQNSDLKGAVAELNSLPVTLDKYELFSIPLPVTNNKFLSSILQDSMPDLKSLSDTLKYIFLKEGVKPSYQPQGRLNLPIKNVVMDEILKIHEIGVT